MLMRGDSGCPKVVVINSNWLLAIMRKRGGVGLVLVRHAHPMLFTPGEEIGSRNLPATIVPGNPGLRPVERVLAPVARQRSSPRLTPLPLPTTRSSEGTRMCISAVNRFVHRPTIGNQRPGYSRILTGSATAASLMPSTGLVSDPASAPAY